MNVRILLTFKFLGKPLRQLDTSLQTSHRDESETPLSDNQIQSSSLRPNNEESSSTWSRLSSPESSSSYNHHTTNSEPNSYSTQETSIKDLKVAVENIQKLFSIHLMEQQQQQEDSDET